MRNYEKVENMTTTNILSLLGGLALFLYGMQMMGNGLEAAAGDRGSLTPLFTTDLKHSA